MRSGSDKTIQCPYNPDHYMPEARLLWHINNKCDGLALVGHLYGTCKFNQYHIIKKELLAKHEAKCKDFR